MVTDLESALQGGKADPVMKKVWGWQWSLLWLFGLWICLGWAIIFDFMMIGAPVITVCMFILSFLVVIVNIIWAPLYWKNYSFEVQEERIIIRRGVISKRKVSISYERIQNVNIVKGVLDRIFKVSNIQIETAGGAGVEGTMEGILDPGPIEEFIHEKVKAIKAGDALGAVSPRQVSTVSPRKIKMALKTLDIECSSCGGEFSVNDKRRPFEITCPHCGVKGEIEQEKRVIFSLSEEKDTPIIEPLIEEDEGNTPAPEPEDPALSTIREYMEKLDVNEDIAGKLYTGGYWILEDLEQAVPAELRMLDGISPTMARKICDRLK